jgi:predicted SprT family Zn-dependent metalloprotease
MAHITAKKITLNPKLKKLFPEEIDKTLRHELAHLLAEHRRGRRKIKAHGDEWKQACVDLGIPDEPRCHNLPVPRRTLKRNFIYECPVCKITLRRVRPIKRKKIACLKCCKRHNHGTYHEIFRFVQLPTAA